MNFNLEEITFIAVTFKSETAICNLLDSVPLVSKKIIVDNSRDYNLKNKLEKNYENIEVIISDNIGQGAGLNIGLKKCQTKFSYILDPDVTFPKNTFSKLKSTIAKIDDFTILTPLNSNFKRPNYKIFKNKKLGLFEKFLYVRNTNLNNDINENIISVCRLDGFSLLLNMSKFKDNDFFDENFFLFRECTDLVVRIVKKKERIYLIKDCLIDHLESKSTETCYDDEIHYTRAWHWMWSKYYFNKKHLGIINASIKIIFNIFTSIIDLIVNYFQNKKNNIKICKMRIYGGLNALLGKKAWYRPRLKSLK
jgi:N-acetylglucosaminyl-diphospho-decaprenol L-rhamnosyltransferase